MRKDNFPTETLIKEEEDAVEEQSQKNGKRKRKMSENQLQALTK